MQDAVAALQSALDELLQAQRSLPDDLARQVAGVIDHTQGVLEAVRAKAQPE